jgi:hypothetical protein
MATDLSALDTVIGLLMAGHQVVIGSRGLRESVVQSRSSLARRAGAFVFRAVAASIIADSTDTQCGFKFFDGPLARMACASLRTAGFAFDVELLEACLRLGAAITEIPVQWRDVTGSTFSVSRHSAAVFRDLGAIWLRSLAQPASGTDEARMSEASPATYAGWAMPVAPLPQLASDGAAS